MPADGWPHAESPFHAGERALQERLGVADRMEAFARRGVRDHMPDQHRDFFANQPFLVVGSLDAAGWPWASMLTGVPGFAVSPDPRTLTVSALPAAGDPLTDSLTVGAPLGLLGIEFATRRRNRLNGRVAAVDGAGFALAVDQSFGNCPQYIHSRELGATEPPREASPPPERLGALDTAAEAAIAGADTFFIATAARTDTPPVGGVDVSHRGGKPGFVRIDDDRTLTVPDYAGNFHFNTFGNLVLDPRAGLLFVDFATGDMLQLVGRVDIIWDGEEVDAFQGAERLWRFTLDHGIRRRGAVPLRWSGGQASPNSLMTGSWEDTAAAIAADRQRNAFRPFRVTRIVDESASIRSFHLEPADGGGLARFAPGQFLTLCLHPEGTKRPLVRTYTVSSAPSDPAYRISVKREPPPAAASNYLHDHVRVGDVIDAKVPRGPFALDAAEERPALLLAGGVGITPMLSMLRHVVHEGRRTRHTRRVTLIHSAPDASQRAFFDEARTLAAASRGAVRYFSLLSRPASGAELGRDANGFGRISADVLQQVLPLDDYDVYLCGPPSFMQDLYEILRRLGIRDARIHAEGFGPSALDRRPDDGAPPAPPADEADEAIVTFAKSGLDMPWTPADGSLLELAEAHGLAPEFGCRNGVCQTCATGCASGTVAYRTPPRAEIDDGKVLICSAVPAKTGNGPARVTLDL